MESVSSLAGDRKRERLSNLSTARQTRIFFCFLGLCGLIIQNMFLAVGDLNETKNGSSIHTYASLLAAP